jgi:purine nucleoside permease
MNWFGGGLIAAAMACLLSAPGFAAPAKIPVRVVVVTTFELGADEGDMPGEFQAWVERMPLKERLPFPAGWRDLRYNRSKQVLGVVTGGGSIHGAASIMALGLDPRFDLSKAYWLVAGIAGIDPAHGSVGSAAWAEWVVDEDLKHEIDAREIPKGWSSGMIPLTRSHPFEPPPPAPGIFSPNVYHLDPGLRAWAYGLTAKIVLDDTPDLQAIRAPYDQAAARTPPRVMEGDEISAMTWWVGDLMNKSAEDWMAYWTGGRGVLATTAMEDSGILYSLRHLSSIHRADFSRVLVLRTASNYSAPGRGETAAGLIAAESSTDSATKLSAFRPSLEAAWRVGDPVVEALSSDWEAYKSKPPTP